MQAKQVIIVRKDLNMRKGKIASQVAHASMSIFFQMMIPDYGLYLDKNEGRYRYSLVLPEGKLGDEVKDWIDGSFTKICVYVNSEEELIDIYNKAKNKKLPCSLIEDNGLTEFNGNITKTCVAIGPANSAEIDIITKHLKLL